MRRHKSHGQKSGPALILRAAERPLDSWRLTVCTCGDDELAECFKQGSPDAFKEIHDSYHAPLFATAMRILGNHEWAADAVQLAFVRAWRAAPDFDASRPLLPWLYAIVRRTAIDVHRSERRTGTTVPSDVLADLAERRGREDDGRDSWLSAEVRCALAELDPHERAVLRLTYYESLTQPEIAEALGIPVGTVKSRTSRARSRLALLLEPRLRPAAAEDPCDCLCA
ncbi:RNA polymerase sigma factor [Sphaerisporangium aureirubrum]|uniref:RNA polymerase sigma factor n=1 Tax=Sphaerisporangium aureirubrum TaxID=1544736 RepID=A0ABW1NR98_9ACTN